MNIAVCLNMIPNPEAPAQDFRFQAGARQPDPWRGAFVMGPFDENALELALQLKQKTQAKVHAVSVGDKQLAFTALRKALAVQADEAVWVDLDPAGLDSHGVATILTAAIRRIGNVDLVLCGRQGGDWDAGQVGLLIAEQLGFTALSLVRQIEEADGASLTAIREMDGGLERVRALLPAVFTVTNDPSNQLRVAKVRDIMMSQRKPVPPVTLQELGLPGLPPPLVEIQALQPPPVRRSAAQILDGQSAAEKVSKLADRIIEWL